MNRFAIILLSMCCMTFIVSAQQITYYSCDFENAQVNAGWELRSGQYANSLTNRWYIGEAINNGGKKSMYISADGRGDSAYYASASNCAVAYVELDLAAGEYILSFDWRARGNISDGLEGLYVCWVPDEEEDEDDGGNPIMKVVPVNNSPQNPIPSYVETYALMLDDFYKRDYLGNSSTWRNKQLVFTADGKPHKLAFMWRSSESVPKSPGACIDNILVMSTSECEAPTNLQLEEAEESVRISWSGDKDAQYNVRYYNYISDKWNEVNVNDTTYLIPDIDEGYNDFYVRKICGRDNLGNIIYSVPLNVTRLVYILARHCGLDYLTLTEQNCFAADKDNGWPSNSTRNVTFSNNVVDLGPEDPLSRHTVHVDPDEIDQMTMDESGYGLRTVPIGEVASVRLGDYFNGHQAQRVEFKFHVDVATNPMVILKYAVVIGYADYHSRDVNPRFELQILDSRHRPLKDIASCATADFTVNDLTEQGDNWREEGWHVIDPKTHKSLPTIESEKIMWKDWTQVGIDLSSHDGEDVIIQLTTYDCAETVHLGYAYFVLKCSRGELEGMSCGQTNPVFKAPDGFLYRWYLQKDSVRVHDTTQPWDESLILGRNQVFEVGTQDTMKYTVDCMFVGDTACSFALNVSSLARFPKAEGEWQLIRENCENRVLFTSDCHMVEENHVSHVITRTSESCDRMMWDFGDGTISYEQNPATHLYPAEGGDFEVKLHAVYETCEDSISFLLNIPPIGTTYDTIPAVGCIGTGYRVRYLDSEGNVEIDKSYYGDGLYNDTVMSSIGCDSVMVLDLKMVDRMETTVDTTIINDQVYEYDSGMGIKTVNTTGVYKGYLLSVAGCDSIVTHNVYVHERLLVNIDPTIDVCADDGLAVIPFTFTSGRTTTYSMVDTTGIIDNIDEDYLPRMSLEEKYGEIEVEMPDQLLVNYYPLIFTFYDSISGNVEVPVRLAVHYPDTILVQKWNDVLALRDSANNGAYNFVGFQWYKGTEKIENATGPYLYLKGEEFDTDDVPYYVELTREDGLVMTTCPFFPTKHVDITPFPSIVGAAQRVPLRIRANCNMIIYDTMGHQYKAVEMQSGLAEFVAPSQSGVYIINVLYDDSSAEKYKLIVH